MILRRLLPVALLLPLLLGAFLLPVQAQEPTESESEAPPGEEHFVEVRDDGFLPADIRIAPGDTIIWVWVGEGPHSVTATPDATNERAFDSHPDCPGILGGGCGTQGDTYSAPDGTFDQPGSFRYGSRHPDDAETHAGTVQVLAPEPEMTPTPTEEPTATPAPTAEPTATEEPTAEPTPTEEPTGTPEPTAEPTETEEPTPDRRPQTGQAPNFTTNSRPVARPQESEAPQVAPSTGAPRPTSTPTFDAFPEAADPDDIELEEPTEDDADQAVVIPDLGDDDGGPGRLVWGLVGGGLLAATATAFGRTVLFSEAWA